MVARISSSRKARHRPTQELLISPKPSERRVAGFLSPSGRVSVGVLPKERPRKTEQDYERTAGKIDVIEQSYYQEGVLQKETKVVLTPSQVTPPLGLSSVPNHQGDGGVLGGGSQEQVLGRVLNKRRQARRAEQLEASYYGENKRGRYGLKGISINGMRRVREGCYLLQRKYHRRLGFYTLTCPYTVPELIWEFNKGIAEIARRFFQDCKKLYEAENQVWSNVFVYEYQDARYQSSGIPVLHIHYVAPCYKRGTTEWVLTATEIRYLWMLSVAAVCGVESDTSASVDAQVIQTSAAGYISKYLSKGGNTVHYLGEIAPSQLPSQWWGCTNNIRKCIKRCTTPLPTEISEYFMAGGGLDPSEVLYTPYRKYIYIDIGYDPVLDDVIRDRRGMSAQLCRDGCKALQTWGIKDLADI